MTISSLSSAKTRFFAKYIVSNLNRSKHHPSCFFPMKYISVPVLSRQILYRCLLSDDLCIIVQNMRHSSHVLTNSQLVVHVCGFVFCSQDINCRLTCAKMHAYQRDLRARAKDKPEVAYFAERERERENKISFECKLYSNV